MNELEIFNNPKFGNIRALSINDEPWFVGRDIAEALGYSNTSKAIGDHVDEEDKGVTKRYTLGGAQEMTVINESGLYSLILSSKLPEAKEFKRWVTSEVLPTIRKTGGVYATDAAIEKTMEDPDYMIGILQKLKAERAKRQEAEKQIEADKPKVVFADAVSVSKTSILIGDLAKILRGNGVTIGQNRLFAWMRDNGYLIKAKGVSYNMPTQRAMEMGLFKVKEGSYINSNGVTVVTKTTKVTGKGQQYFINKFLEKNLKKAE
jgi:anti-repressor protein|nr:MAG TPA: repressor domain protein [Caudoviricetes sp.]